MVEGTTKSGFVFAIEDDALDDYEMLEKLRVADKDPLKMIDAIEGLLGPEQLADMKNHVRNDRGRVTITDMMAEFGEIMSFKPVKNS